jgi:hypothetical protein
MSLQYYGNGYVLAIHGTCGLRNGYYITSDKCYDMEWEWVIKKLVLGGKILIVPQRCSGRNCYGKSYYDVFFKSEDSKIDLRLLEPESGKVLDWGSE